MKKAKLGNIFYFARLAEERLYENIDGGWSSKTSTPPRGFEVLDRGFMPRPTNQNSTGRLWTF